MISPFEISLHGVRLEHFEAAFLFGVVFILVVVLKILRKNREEHFRLHSEIKTFGESGESFFSKLFRSATYLLLGVVVVLLLVAFATPKRQIASTSQIFISRERVDLIDVSASMCFEYRETGKPLGYIARRAHLRFLELRKGKKDRVSLWLFSSNTYKVQDFITDDEVYRFQVFSAPNALTRRSNGVIQESFWVCDEGEFKIIEGEGGTRLGEALTQVADYFERESNKELEQKTVVIVTDAAVDRVPTSELQRLKTMEVRPYIFFVRPSERIFRELGVSNSFLMIQFLNSEKFLRDITFYGGHYYDISDEESLREAYEEVDRLEGVRVREKVKVKDQDLFGYVLVGALLVFSITLLLGFFYESIWGKLN